MKPAEDIVLHSNKFVALKQVQRDMNLSMGYTSIEVGFDGCPCSACLHGYAPAENGYYKQGCLIAGLGWF